MWLTGSETRMVDLIIAATVIGWMSVATFGDIFAFPDLGPSDPQHPSHQQDRGEAAGVTLPSLHPLRN